jgi:hypothetical protein
VEAHALLVVLGYRRVVAEVGLNKRSDDLLLYAVADPVPLVPVFFGAGFQGDEVGRVPLGVGLVESRQGISGDVGPLRGVGHTLFVHVVFQIEEPYVKFRVVRRDKIVIASHFCLLLPPGGGGIIVKKVPLNRRNLLSHRWKVLSNRWNLPQNFWKFPKNRWKLPKNL